MSNRATLKTYFAAGALPTQKHFEDLIESNLNMQDEGFRRSPENGVEISKLDSRDAFISFYAKPDAQAPSWSMSGDKAGRLVFRPESAMEPVSHPVLSLATRTSDDPDGGPPRLDPRVGIATAAPEHELDVAGTVRMHARLGGYVPKQHRGADGAISPDGIKALNSIRADGNWHDITEPLTGCHAFEVVAGTGSRDRGRYGMAHAIALNTYHPRYWLLDFFTPKRPIRTTSAYYDRRCDMLMFRWHCEAGAYGKNAEYTLQVKSRCAYPDGTDGKPPVIRCRITQLWLDPLMEDLAV